MKYKFQDLLHQYHSIKDDIDAALNDILSTSAFIGGPIVSDFEQQFSSFVGTRHCLGVGNGTDALEIALEALDLPPGSEVIVPSNSFIASSEAVTRTGHKIVFADVDPNTYNLSLSTIKQVLSPSTRAIIVVHLYGRPAPVEEIYTLASSLNIKVIEDCAQAHGSYISGKHVGSFGDISAFSFYPGKNLGAYGDAGAIVTNSPELATKVRLIANHGRLSKYNHEIEGRNSRLDTLQAAVLRVKLSNLPSWISQRITNARMYHTLLSDLDQIVLPNLPLTHTTHSYHLFVVRVGNRPEFQDYLQRNGVPTGVHYPIALPNLPAYCVDHSYTSDYFSTQVSSSLVSLPVAEHLTESDISNISKIIRGYFTN